MTRSAPSVRRHRRVAAFAVTVLATGAAIAIVAPSALAAVEQTFYVSPSGSGTTCTAVIPCALATAKSQVEAETSSMTGDLVVQLAGGTYALSSPLTFGASDSGESGHEVIYQAASGQAPLISGGSSVTGWTLHDSVKNIWEASVPVGTHTRQLYVNGARAVLAREDAETALGAMTQTSTGYTVSNTAIDSWSNVSDVDFSWPAQGRSAPALDGVFTDSFCAVSAVSGSAVTMENPCYSNASRHVTDPMPNVGLPSFIENNYALLSAPGQFYVDSGAGELYYIPRTGETMSTATVILPTLQGLVAASGVSNMTFTGLTFAYATWLPSVTQGVVDTQADELQTTGWQPAALMPANVAFADATDITFSDNTLIHLGGAGVGFNGGGSGNDVIGNLVTDVSGSGIDISNGDSYTVAPSPMESNDTVTDNYVHDVAVEYLGGAGIFAGWTKGTTISHNDVSHTPWVGITLGWGWGSQTAAMSDNHIDYNYVHDTMETALYDGGSIYVNNGQNGSYTVSSTIEGNYVVGDPQQFGEIYLDNAASNFVVYQNVIAHTATNWIYLQGGTNGAVDNAVEYNYSDSSTMSSYLPSNTVANNQTGLTSWPSAATAIISSAGLEPTYAALLSPSTDRNLSYQSTAYGSSNTSTEGQANDGNSSSSSTWSTAAGDPYLFWETDLGAAYTLSELEILMPQGVDDPTGRENFQVQVSNTAAMTSGNYTVACTQGAYVLPYQWLYSCALPAGPYRYLAIVKTDGQPFGLGEVRVFGH